MQRRSSSTPRHCFVPPARASRLTARRDIGIDLTPLFETIVNYIPAPTGDCEAPLQMLVSSIDYNEYVGRIGIGRIERGTIRQNQEITICDYHDPEMIGKGQDRRAVYV